MKSKISCFNKTIFKKNITQFWPLWIGYLIFMLALGPINLYQRMTMNSYYGEFGISRQLSAVASCFNQMTYSGVLFFFATAAVMAVFSYLFTAKNANGIHALPVTRLELFCTNFISAFGILSVIDVAVFIISIFVGISCNVTRLDILFYGLLLQLGITFFAVAFAIVCAMLTGQLLVLPIYCLIGNYLYVGVWYLVEHLIERIIYGMVDHWIERKSFILSPLYYLNNQVSADTVYNRTTKMIDDITVKGGGVVAVYALAAVFLLVVAYLFYRKRQLETAGDIVSVSFMKPVFRWGVGILGGLAGGLIISELLFHATTQSDRTFRFVLGCSMFLAIIGFFGAEMLMQKNFRVFKKHILLEGACVLLIILGVTGSLKLDLFGIEKHIPDAEEVAYAYVDLDYPIRFEGETLKEMFVLHKQALESKERNLAADENGEATGYAEFYYKLTDGTSFRRRYLLPLDTKDPCNNELVSGKVMELELNPERMKKHLLGDNYSTNQFLTGYIGLYDEHQNYFEYRFDEEEINVIADAMMQDFNAGNLEIYQIWNASGDRDDRFLNCISLTYYNEEGIEREEDFYYNGINELYELEGGAYAETTTYPEATVDYAFSAEVDMESIYFDFGKQCTNLLHALKELQITDETWHLYTYDEYDALEQRLEK